MLRTQVTLLCCALVSCLAASLSSEEVEAPKQHSHHKVHSHHKHNNIAVGADVQLGVLPKGSVVRREGALEQDDTMLKHKYATTPTPRPMALAPLEVGMSALQDEPHVSCGKHVASECSACVLSHGPDWCHGDCIWDSDEAMCKINDQPQAAETSTTDVFPQSEGAAESAESDDAIATKLRREQEAAEAQEKTDRDKFWATVGISAGVSSLLIMFCGVVAICFCFSKEKPGKDGVEEPLLEGNEAEAADEEDEGEAVEAEGGYAP